MKRKHRIWPRLAALATLLSLVACPAEAQNNSSITVAVELVDSTGALSGAFAAALRSLGDVSVLSHTERPRYVLAGLVVCNPSCSSADTYLVSLRLFSPIQPDMAEYLAWGSMSRSGAPAGTKVDSIYAFIWSQLKSLEDTHITWVASWGRNRYELAVRELVREIDVKCFDRDRMLRRADALPRADSVRLREIYREVNSRHWIC